MADNSVKEIDDLVKIISRLPGLGPKSAKRIVLKLINNREELIKPLTNTLAQVYKKVVRCNICGNLKSLDSDCICTSKTYDQICVRKMFSILTEGNHDPGVQHQGSDQNQKCLATMLFHNA